MYTLWIHDISKYLITVNIWINIDDIFFDLIFQKTMSVFITLTITIAILLLFIHYIQNVWSYDLNEEPSSKSKYDTIFSLFFHSSQKTYFRWVYVLIFHIFMWDTRYMILIKRKILQNSQRCSKNTYLMF